MQGMAGLGVRFFRSTILGIDSRRSNALQRLLSTC